MFDIEKNFSVDGNEDIDINRDTLPIFEYRTDGEKSSGFNDNYEVVQKPGKKNRGIIRKIVSGIKREGRINSYATKTFAEEYICNNCGAILNEQVGFSPGNETWVCSNCNMVLNRDNPRGSIKSPGVHWYCDNCNTNLNIQEDFTDTEGKWTCTRCGHINTIDDDQILKKG